MRANKSERRSSKRKGLDLLVNRFLNGYPYLCKATDISRTGMRLARLREPSGKAMPRFMGLQFQLPGSRHVITASGEMVFDDHRNGDLGVRFTGLPAATVADIESFLAGGSHRGNC